MAKVLGRLVLAGPLFFFALLLAYELFIKTYLNPYPVNNFPNSLGAYVEYTGAVLLFAGPGVILTVGWPHFHIGKVAGIIVLVSIGMMIGGYVLVPPGTVVEIVPNSVVCASAAGSYNGMPLGANSCGMTLDNTGTALVEITGVSESGHTCKGRSCDVSLGLRFCSPIPLSKGTCAVPLGGKENVTFSRGLNGSTESGFLFCNGCGKGSQLDFTTVVR